MDAIGILLLATGYGLYVLFLLTVIKSSLKLKHEDASRIVDLLLIGSILYLTQVIPIKVPVNSVALSGFLIFLYGFIILIYKKFKEGLEDSI